MGLVQIRTRHYAPGEGHAIDVGEWPYAHILQLDDGWLAAWGFWNQEGWPYLLCPYHARGERILRPDEFAFVGEVEIDLPQFDYIGAVARDIVMFKHVATKRSLNLAERNGRAVCDFDSKVGVVEREVDEGFRYARNSR